MRHVFGNASGCLVKCGKLLLGLITCVLDWCMPSLVIIVTLACVINMCCDAMILMTLAMIEV